MSLGDHIAPFVTEHLGGAFEKRPPMPDNRRRVAGRARGRVLEVGAGTGFNLPYYRRDAVDELVVTDALEGMLRRAGRRARTTGLRVTLTRAAVERLPFPDASFDTVVATFVLCSVDDQELALHEIRRVLAPGGRYVFLEHVRSDDPALARRQDQLEGLWRRACFGCRPNRDTLPRVQAAFSVEEVDRAELPFGPRIVRPYVLGSAIRS